MTLKVDVGRPTTGKGGEEQLEARTLRKILRHIELVARVTSAMFRRQAKLLALFLTVSRVERNARFRPNSPK